MGTRCRYHPPDRCFTWRSGPGTRVDYILAHTPALQGLIGFSHLAVDSGIPTHALMTAQFDLMLCGQEALHLCKALGFPPEAWDCWETAKKEAVARRIWQSSAGSWRSIIAQPDRSNELWELFSRVVKHILYSDLECIRPPSTISRPWAGFRPKAAAIFAPQCPDSCGCFG